MKLILEKAMLGQMAQTKMKVPMSDRNLLRQTGNAKTRFEKHTIGVSDSERTASNDTQMKKATSKIPLNESAGAGLGLAAVGAAAYGGKKALDNVFEKAEAHNSALDTAMKSLNEDSGASIGGMSSAGAMAGGSAPIPTMGGVSSLKKVIQQKSI